jgi:hypothetical protein
MTSYIVAVTMWGEMRIRQSRRTEGEGRGREGK